MESWVWLPTFLLLFASSHLKLSWKGIEADSGRLMSTNPKRKGEAGVKAEGKAA